MKGGWGDEGGWGAWLQMIGALLGELEEMGRGGEVIIVHYLEKISVLVINLVTKQLNAMFAKPKSDLHVCMLLVFEGHSHLLMGNNKFI